MTTVNEEMNEVEGITKDVENNSLYQEQECQKTDLSFQEKVGIAEQTFVLLWKKDKINEKIKNFSCTYNRERNKMTEQFVYFHHELLNLSKKDVLEKFSQLELEKHKLVKDSIMKAILFETSVQRNLSYDISNISKVLLLTLPISCQKIELITFKNDLA